MNNLSTHRLSTNGLSVKAYRASRGFSLLEALIGFMILSIGMLGIASLQGISLKAGKTSVYGSVAMMKVEELFESMRANSSVAALNAYAANGGGAGVANACSGTGGCLPAALALDDIYWWRKNLTAGLPATASTITAVAVVFVPPPSRLATVTVTINWNERNKDNLTSVTKTYTSSTNICTVIPC